MTLQNHIGWRRMCKKEIDSTGNNCIRNTQYSKTCIEELCLNQILVVFSAQQSYEKK